MARLNNAPRSIEIAPGLEAHASGALWVASARAVLVADTHLGYAWALRRRGELGPLAEGGAREQLEAVVEELTPQRLVLLGDVVHAPNPSMEERAVVEATLGALMRRTAVTVVLGNHDREFARDYAGLEIEVVKQWREAGVVAVHGDRIPARIPRGAFLVLGHLHPAFSVYDAAGAGHCVRVFVVGERGAVLPAFSPFSTGLNVSRGLPPEVQRALGRCAPQAIAATGNRVVRLGPLRCGSLGA